jgi:hypothetical protein
MASLAACNLIAMLEGYPVSAAGDVGRYFSGEPPKSAPSIVNAADLGLAAEN